MSLSTCGLIPIRRVDQAPEDTYILYDMNGGIYTINHKKYSNFSKIFARLKPHNVYLTLDLSSAITHSLLFDFDIKLNNTLQENEKIQLLQNYLDHVISLLKTLFIIPLKNFTMIVTTRIGGDGFHIHLPEIELSHDDYVQFCTYLQPQLQYDIDDSIECRLDIPCNATIATCRKPNNKHPYKPSSIYYFDEQNTFLWQVDEHDQKKFNILYKQFKRRKDNTNSFFRRFLSISFQDRLSHLNEYTMPITTPFKPIHKLSYPTVITKEEDNGKDYDMVANFAFKGEMTMYIFKNKEYKLNSSHWLIGYRYLKLNTCFITHFESNNNAFNVWYKRNQNTICFDNDGIFRHINQALKGDNFKFHKDPNPIRTVMQYDHGYYFLPCFYALYQDPKIDSTKLIENMRSVFDTSHHTLLDRLEKINPKILTHISKSFTRDTILYCAANMDMKDTRMREKLQLIVRGMKGTLSVVTTSQQLVEQIHHIQKRYFPIIVANYIYSCKKAQKIMWNFTEEHWQDVVSNSEVKDLVITIWDAILQHLKTHCPEMPKGIVQGVNISHILASIHTEANIDRENIEMDRHKWHIRTEYGILDLLTGHVGGTVPDFFMSEQALHLPFPRLKLIKIRTEFKHLSETYRLLTNKSFFQGYLKALFDNLTNDLLDTLKEKIRDAGLYVEGDPLTSTMYHFYVHFCKYMCFEYENIMYLLDVVSSVLIATNYVRKFFIFKGRTRNGKSKFFQMLAHVLGGYSHTIRSVNLQPNKNTLSAQPELASTLFNRRLVMIEEMSGKLDEAMVKDITGNSATSFRNLYEQTTGGVPTAKLFASTNNDPMCTSTEAFRDRVVAFPMEADFTETAVGLRTSEQVTHDRYVLETDVSVIEDSWLGFFLMIYIHLGEKLNFNDGMLHYRPEPEALVEFKTHILYLTDIYVQFVQYMDVQEMPGTLTTFTDLKSAIRQFLKSIKQSSVRESDIICRFDTEYQEMKRTENEYNNYGGTSLEEEVSEEGTLQFLNNNDENNNNNNNNNDNNNNNNNNDENNNNNDNEDIDDENDKRRKLMKKEQVKMIVYYDGVIIKNLRKDNKFFK